MDLDFWRNIRWIKLFGVVLHKYKMDLDFWSSRKWDLDLGVVIEDKKEVL